MYTRTYPKGVAQKIPENYGGTVLEREPQEAEDGQKSAPVCCESTENRQEHEAERAREAHTPNGLHGALATGDLLLLALAALLTQGDAPDSELVMLLLLLLLY